MGHAYADEKGFGHVGPHRFKLHTRDMPLRGGIVTKYEVEWQRDWEKLFEFTFTASNGERISYRSTNSWESTTEQFESEAQAIAFVSLVLSGDIPNQKKDDGAVFVEQTHARRTHPWGN
jgi:hypothetical protein